MSLVARLEADHKAARTAALRGGDKALPLLLGTLLGDLVTEARKKENRPPTDAEAEAKVIAFISGARTNVAAAADRPELKAKYEAEIAALVPYAPHIPDAAEIRAAIAAFRETEPGAAIGPLMKHLRDRYGAGLDGKLAKAIATEG